MLLHCFSYPNLQSLDLSNNKINSLTPGSLAENQKLTRLNLENNQFDFLPAKALRQAQTITSLKIGQNPLKELGSWGFTALKILTDLDISNITTLNEIKVNLYSLSLQVLCVSSPTPSKALTSSRRSSSPAHCWIRCQMSPCWLICVC